MNTKCARTGQSSQSIRLCARSVLIAIMAIGAVLIPPSAASAAGQPAGAAAATCEGRLWGPSLGFAVGASSDVTCSTRQAVIQVDVYLVSPLGAKSTNSRVCYNKTYCSVSTSLEYTGAGYWTASGGGAVEAYDGSDWSTGALGPVTRYL
jgi:hypothetical protein